jgi:hypothetical protein
VYIYRYIYAYKVNSLTYTNPITQLPLGTCLGESICLCRINFRASHPSQELEASRSRATQQQPSHYKGYNPIQVSELNGTHPPLSWDQPCRFNMLEFHNFTSQLPITKVEPNKSRATQHHTVHFETEKPLGRGHSVAPITLSGQGYAN